MTASHDGKYNAAKLALNLVKDEIVLGIGSGSTVEIFLKLLEDRIKSEELTLYGIPSSYRSHMIAAGIGIKIVDLFEHPEPDLCIDGADQVDSELNCVKGGGGALTREKIVAAASKRVVIIADESKLSKNLFIPVPVEVLPFACGYVMKRLEQKANSIKLRDGTGKLGPVVTDNGNFILDCDLGVIKEPKKIEVELNCIAGVVENGIFPYDLIDAVIVGNNSSARYL